MTHLLIDIIAFEKKANLRCKLNGIILYEMEMPLL